MPLALSQSNPDVGSSPSFCSGRKLGDIEPALLWSLLQEDPQCPSRLLLDEAARRQRPIAVSLRQLNRWRVQWQLNRRPGRPRQTPRKFRGGRRRKQGLRRPAIREEPLRLG